MDRDSSPRLTQVDGRPLSRALTAARLLVSRGPRPTQQFARRLATRFLTGRLPTMLATYEDGRRFIIPARDTMYTAVFIAGAWEGTESQVIQNLLRPGDIAIDIGANHGWFTLLMAKAVGASGEVLAIEPVPSHLEALEQNLSRNPGLRTRIYREALGASPGDLEIHLFEGLPHGHASASDLGRNDFEKVSVPVERLDGLLKNSGHRAPALVKVDVEGAELEVLSGATKLAASPQAPIWTLEVNYETAAAFGYRPVELLDRLRSLSDYRVFRVGPCGLEQERSATDAPHGVMWVCVPPNHTDRLGPIGQIPARHEY